MGARYRLWGLGVVRGCWVPFVGIIHGCWVVCGVVVGCHVVGVIVGHVMLEPRNDNERPFLVIVRHSVAMSLSATWQL